MSEEEVIYTTEIDNFNENEKKHLENVQRFFDNFYDNALELDEDEASLEDIHDDLCKIDADLKMLAYFMSLSTDQKVNEDEDF